MEGSVMKIQSMDAMMKQAVNIVQAEPRQEVPVEQAKPQANSANGTTKEPYQGEKYMEKAEKVSDAFIRKAVDRVNQTFELEKRSLKFQIHDRLNEVMVKVIDSETQEVIREIPPEKLLDMFASMLELAGLLVDEKR